MKCWLERGYKWFCRVAEGSGNEKLLSASHDGVQGCDSRKDQERRADAAAESAICRQGNYGGAV